MSPDEVRAFFDNFAQAAGTQGVLRVGKLAAATEAGQQLVSEAVRRGIRVELNGTSDQ